MQPANFYCSINTPKTNKEKYLCTKVCKFSRLIKSQKGYRYCICIDIWIARQHTIYILPNLSCILKKITILQIA